MRRIRRSYRCGSLPKIFLVKECKGFFCLMEGLQLERLVGAIGAIAGTEYLEYMAQRQAFGRPLNLHHRMAQLHAETQAMQSYVYHACRLFADRVYAVEECTIAKLLATELANKAAYECLQMLGG